MRFPDSSAAPAEARLSLQLVGCDLDGDTSESRIWWTFILRDDRLDNGEIWLHVATPRCGWSLVDVFHTDIGGLSWPDRDDATIGADYWPGWPLDDPELVRAVGAAIEHELVRVDLARTLLAPVTVIPWRSMATRQEAA
ncbi:MAG: hypothetical protein WKF96_25400 [Solirubrobacteraceae bacterium]